MHNSFGKALLLAALFMIVIVASWDPHTVSLRLDDLSDVMSVLGGIFIVVLLVERATEIVINIWRQPKAAKLKRELEASKNAEKQTELADYQIETKNLALFIGFTLSVIVCAAGVGLLGAVFDTASDPSKLFRGVDILLTSALIAGGSDGFHQFVSALESFFSESKKRMTDKPDNSAGGKEA